MRKLVLAATFIVMATPVAARAQLSIVEGAACAQSSAYIEQLGDYNQSVYNEIGEMQASSDPKLQGRSNSLIVHYERMVEFRRKLIAEYDVLCAHASMNYSDYRKVCGVMPSGRSFADTVFCKPLKSEEN